MAKSLFPLDFIQLYQQDLTESLRSHHYFNQVINDLTLALTPEISDAVHTVRHGDLHHHNFIRQNGSTALFNRLGRSTNCGSD